MKHILLALSMLLAILAQSQVPNFDWVRSGGGAEIDGANDVAVHDNRVYVVGFFADSGDFDPSPYSELMLTSSGANDIFITAFDKQGILQWAHSIGGGHVDEAYACTTDSDGNLYVGGYFANTVDFDPDPNSTANLFSTNSSIPEAYIVKFDSLGNFIWVKHIPDGPSSKCFDLHCDKQGYLYATGWYQGSADFDPSSGSYALSANGASDIYVVKLDTSGAFIWAKDMGGNHWEKATSLDVDSAGNVFVTGNFAGTVDFDPGFANVSLSTSGPADYDFFVLKLDPNGNLLWAHSFPGAYNNDEGMAITSDQQGNAFITGRYGATIDFDPDTASVTAITVAGFIDLFILKLNPSGGLMWVKSIGSTGPDWGRAIDVDSLGNPVIAGSHSATVDFDPDSTATSFLSSSVANAFNSFILKLDTGGNFEWVRGFEGSEFDWGAGLVVDADQSIYTAGRFSDSADFNPSAQADYWLQASGPITVFDRTDYYLHHFVMDSCAHSYSTAIVQGCDSYTWIDGVTYSQNTIFPTYALSSVSGCDSVITLNVELSQSSDAIDSATACDTYTWINGTTYIASNSVDSFMLTNSVGCDSIVFLELEVQFSDSVSQAVEACNSYTWVNGVTYTNSDTGSAWFTNVHGCDSVVFLDLIVFEPDTTWESVDACDSYTWEDGVTYLTSDTVMGLFSNIQGCDSVVYLDLNIQSSDTAWQIVEACNSYTWINGTTYETSDTASVSFTNAQGCDSVIYLDLDIRVVSSVHLVIDSVSIHAVNVGQAYQWLACDSGFVLLPGDTGQTYVPSASGSYAVEITEAGCTDTSACVLFTMLGLQSPTGETIRVFPNPAQDAITFQLEETGGAVELRVYEANGRLVQSFAPVGNTVTVNLSGYSSGLYYYTLVSGRDVHTGKFMKAE